MSFKLPRSSLINLDSARTKARTSTLQFSIRTDKGDVISGILKNKPKYSIEANYDRLINMDDTFATLNKVGGYIGGIQVGLTKEWTQQVFKGGSYLSIQLQARLIDDELGSSLVYRTKRLISLCNPRNVFNAVESGATLKEIDEKGIERQTQDKANSSGKMIPGSFDYSKPAPNQDVTLNSTGKKSVPEMLANVGTLGYGLLTNLGSSIPPLCNLSISNYFRMGGFYVKSVAFEFSHEQTENGPLYSDIDIELIQSQIVKDVELRNAFVVHKNFSN